MAKTATTRKKKIKRAFTKGVAHIHSTFNNTIVTITDDNRQRMVKLISEAFWSFLSAKSSTNSPAGNSNLILRKVLLSLYIYIQTIQ